MEGRAGPAAGGGHGGQLGNVITQAGRPGGGGAAGSDRLAGAGRVQEIGTVSRTQLEKEEE